VIVAVCGLNDNALLVTVGACREAGAEAYGFTLDVSNRDPEALHRRLVQQARNHRCALRELLAVGRNAFGALYTETMAYEGHGQQRP
jgi:hypothetical protein